MNKPFVYQSVLAPFIHDFIAMKEASGFDSLRTKWILLEIDRFYCSKEVKEPVITKKLIAEWEKTRVNDHPGTLYTKFSVLSQLARYMSRHGQDCHIPQLPKYSRSNTDFTPYIFTPEQIRDIFEKSDELRVYDAHMNSTIFCIPSVLRLLYSTGLRISEALSIRNQDVAFERNFIHIRKTKTGHERIVPVNDELENVLKQYMSYRDKMPVKGINAPDGFLFVKPDGTYCTPQSVYQWFRKILSKCNIPYKGNHHGPRVHDLRHSFSVHALVQTVRNGQDIYAGLPIIATCLGHTSVSSTEQYVRLVEMMYPELIKQCSPVSAYVFPKINLTSQLP
jgi:site-specific recombinase XerD